MPLNPAEREALADIRSGLEREDRAFTESFTVLSAVPVRRWALLACAALVAGAGLFALLGPTAVAVIGFVLVLAAPVVAVRAAELSADLTRDDPPTGAPRPGPDGAPGPDAGPSPDREPSPDRGPSPHASTRTDTGPASGPGPGTGLTAGRGSTARDGRPVRGHSSGAVRRRTGCHLRRSTPTTGAPRG